MELDFRWTDFQFSVFGIQNGVEWQGASFSVFGSRYSKWRWMAAGLTFGFPFSVLEIQNLLVQNLRILTFFTIITNFYENYEFLRKLRIFTKITNFYEIYDVLRKSQIFTKITNFYDNYEFLRIFTKITNFYKNYQDF
jgi:hypothetical protein